MCYRVTPKGLVEVMQMFKRAVMTDEISQDPGRAVAIARKFGLDGVELRSAWEKNPHELSRVEIGKINALIRDAGLQMPCVAAPVFKCRLEEPLDYLAHLEILKRSIEVAHALGADLVRGFTFWDDGRFAHNLPLIAEKIATVAPILADGGVTLALESDPATYANSNQKLALVLPRVAADHVKALWDPGNNIYVKDAGRPFPEGYETLRPYLAHVHVKDVKLDPATGVPEACRVGDGAVGFAAVFKRLSADGYRGWASLETHYRLRGSLSEELLALPKGGAFSLGGEEASLESLRSWEEILKAEGLC